MDTTPCQTFCQLVGMLKSLIPWQSEPANLSRDFWMPDHICRVCYECDSQFTLFNRRHHCRVCGRVFCARCTANSVPAPSGDPSETLEEQEKVRSCNFCYKQWEKGLTTLENGIWVSKQGLSTSLSAISLASTISSGTGLSSSITIGSLTYSIGKYQQFQCSSNLSPHHSPFMETTTDGQIKVAPGRSNDLVTVVMDLSPKRYGISVGRIVDDDDEYAEYQTTNIVNVSSGNDYYSQVEFDEMSNGIGSHMVHPDGEGIDKNCLNSPPIEQNIDSQACDGISQLGENENEHDMGDEGEASSSLYAVGTVDAEPVDFENNGLLWLPPEPEDEDDENEPSFFDDDDDGNATEEWGCLPMSSSFGTGESRNKDRSNEEQKRVMKNMVDRHFRALLAQLLQAENLPLDEVDDKENWLEIITSLSWEAATLLKPDMSKSGGMDPGGYVKVKCIPSGHRIESMVVKGVVCKKNVAHRRMASKIEKPRILILGGALEYQRVSNHLSSFDTLLQQEMDHLKMAVAKIDAQKPSVLLVEKSVSRFAQEYLLAKDISLVLNVKRTLLDRLVRCTGAQVVPSIDHLSSQKLGYCETFHVERYAEDLGTAVQGGKNLLKTLMFFEGCPKPLGCTILLRGADRDELKKVKHVIQYGVFAAYHLGLETSFLADEGASLPEFQLDPSITVALPDKSSSILRSISLVPGFSVTADGKFQGPNEPQLSVPIADLSSNLTNKQSSHNDLDSASQPSSNIINVAASNSSSPGKVVSDVNQVNLSLHHAIGERSEMGITEPQVEETSAVNNSLHLIYNQMTAENLGSLEALGQDLSSMSQNDQSAITANEFEACFSQDGRIHNEDQGYLKDDHGIFKEDFPPSPSDHQSILVSLSSRCVWKGTVCERSHLFRIKYYGSFDKPLGRFLRDHLFDQGYRCQFCDMPSEAHVHCYTHRQGTLTISVKKLSEILLPGERDGKIWMWHRCLRCPRTDGFPPATRRIVMSDAAWGLSFGKFLELSFSNHAAASRVASCGHSLHRDCLRFYGFGKMVACFRYASIAVLSVYLPPSKLDFNNVKHEWIQKEIDEVIDRAELLFSEVLNALRQIEEKRSATWLQNNGTRTSEYRRQIVELEAMLQKEKTEFEESLQKTLKSEAKQGQPLVDILEISRLRRQLLFQSYMWDHRLIYASSPDNDSFQDHLSPSASKRDREPPIDNENLTEMDVVIKTGKGYKSCDSLLLNLNLNKSLDFQTGIGSRVNLSNIVNQETDVHSELDHVNEAQTDMSSDVNTSGEPYSLQVNTKVRRTLSDGQILVMTNLFDTLDAAWTGENHTELGKNKESPTVHPDLASTFTDGFSVDLAEDQNCSKVLQSLPTALSTKGAENAEDSVSWLTMPFLNFYRTLNKNFLTNAQKLDTLGEYNSIYVSTFRNAELQGGARLLLPVGVNDTVVPVYDDEPTSIISYALVSAEYQLQVNDEGERRSGEFLSSTDLLSSQSVHLSDDTPPEPYRSHESGEDSILSLSGSLGSVALDPLSCTKALHPRVSFEDDGPLGKVKYSVTCYCAKWFESLRRICCPSELDYVRSLSRCKKWGAQGGKSNVFFAKTLDERFVIKQVTKTELESFIKFATGYFKYLSESIRSRSPTCLAKILGIYQVTTKHVKGGKETKMDVLVMENLLFGRNVNRLYDLKGSSRSRYNPDCSGSDKVLLDQNLIEAMLTSPIFVGNKAKRLLSRAVWNDTAFLATIDVMDYSLLVGVDEEKHELVLGIIDFMRQYTWDKHLETWVKASGILGGPKNASPTVISPMQYKKRFRKAMQTYFLMVPDQWSPPSVVSSKSQSDFCEENSQGGTSVE